MPAPTHRSSLFALAFPLVVGAMLGGPALVGRAIAAADNPPTGCIGSDWSGASGNSKEATNWSIIQPRENSWLSIAESYNTHCWYTNSYGKYRTDCSGFVSMAWGLDQQYSTYEFNPGQPDWVHLTQEISWNEIEPGDALVINQGTRHHIALVISYNKSTHTGVVAEESGEERDDHSVVPTITATFGETDSYWGDFTPIRYNNFTPGVTPPTVSGEANLAPNGDFNASAVGWNHSGTTNMVRYASGTGGATAYEGGGYLATNTSSAGGNIAADITRTIVAGETYCVSGQFTSLGSSGGSGGLALWLLGGTTESASKGVGSLSVGTWTPAQTCVTATSAHSTIRVQFYPTVHGQTVGLDAINLNHNLATNGDFNASSDGWSATGAGTHMVRYASGSGGSTAYEGAGWLATNAATGGGSVVLDRTITVHAGDTYCVSAQLTTAGLGTSGGGSLAIWFMGGSGNEGSNKTVSGLDGSSVWTPATTCTTATGEHTTVRVQFYPTVGGPTVGIDAVNLTRNLVPNAGFNDSTSGWAHGGATTNMVRYSSGTSGTTAYEGSSYLATNTTTAGGSVFTDIPVAIHAGDSYCVTAHLTTLGAGSGGGGLALWFMGGSNEGSSKGVSALPGKSIWTPVTTCSTATTDHTTLRVQFYPTVGGATVGIDAVTID